MFYRYIVLTAVAGALSAQTPCEKLADLKLHTTTIASAQLVAAGPMPGQAAVQLPERCVVKAAAHPSADSDIKFELWLPTTTWNGKYEQVGNGGFAGAIPTGSIAAGVLRGYATAGTDDGHVTSGTNAVWAVGHPEKLIDFGFRAVHETSVYAKAIIHAFYGKDPTRNYFAGCSDGGREALMEAQRFPEDFEGIVAGAPASDWSNLLTAAIWDEQAMLKEPGSTIPPAKLAIIQKASLEACDALDGVKDGVVEDPRACHFDPTVLVCKGADGPDCLTAAQAAAVKKIYDGPSNPRTGKKIFPGRSPGAEAIQGGWNPWIAAAQPTNALLVQFGNGYWGQAVYEDSNWDFRTFGFDSELEYGYKKAGWVLSSDSPDLRSFRAHGGKLIQYHGWGDAAIAPQASIDYYEKVLAFMGKYPDARNTAGKSVPDFYRLFMVPGMGHCGGGNGPNIFGNAGAPAPGADADHDVIMALERWVEKGVAPEKIIGAGKSAIDATKKLTRPLCVYPQVAKYNGSGDSNDASSFTCK